jgi:hypothetical protein
VAGSGLLGPFCSSSSHDRFAAVRSLPPVLPSRCSLRFSSSFCSVRIWGGHGVRPPPVSSEAQKSSNGGFTCISLFANDFRTLVQSVSSVDLLLCNRSFYLTISSGARAVLLSMSAMSLYIFWRNGDLLHWNFFPRL